MKELVFLDSIDSPVGNIYIILQTKSLATIMRTSYKYGYNMAIIPLTKPSYKYGYNMAIIPLTKSSYRYGYNMTIIPLTKSEYTYSKNRRLDILV